MQISIDINDDHIAKKILKFLDTYIKDGIVVKKITEQSTLQSKYSDEYLKKNWKDFIVTSSDPDIDDDEQLPKAYVDYLNDKNTL